MTNRSVIIITVAIFFIWLGAVGAEVLKYDSAAKVYGTTEGWKSMEELEAKAEQERQDYPDCLEYHERVIAQCRADLDTAEAELQQAITLKEEYDATINDLVIDGSIYQ